MPVRKTEPPIKPVPLDFSRGMWASGDAARMPPGFARSLRNLVKVDDVWCARPPLTFDDLTNVRGLGLWYDEVSRAYRLIATDYDGASYHAYVKEAAGESWGADISGANAFFGTIIDSTTFRGTWLGIAADGDGLPLRVFSYDGSTFTRDAALPFAPYSITTYKNRVIYGGARFRGTNLVDDIAVYAYNPSLWTANNVSMQAIVGDDGSTRYRVTPTDAADADLSLILPSTVSGSVGSVTDDIIKYLSQLAGVDHAYEMPITLQIKYASVRADGAAYALGQVITVPTYDGFRFRCSQSGNADVAAPVFGTTTGDETTDGTAKFVCDGSDVAKAYESYVPSAGGARWSEFVVTALIPNGSRTDIAIVLKFGNTETPTYQLAPIDFGFTDGLSISDPRKQNHGQQVTSGDFDYPFFSNETTTPFVIDLPSRLYFSEPLQPLTVNATNRYDLMDLPGGITAVRPFGSEQNGQLFVGKRSGYWLFGVTENINTPLLPNGSARTSIGVLNPKALDTAPDGSLFGIGNNFAWNLRLGNEQVIDICTNAMRTEMMTRGDSWAEYQNAPANRALLVVNSHEKRVYCYTQRGRVHVYSFEAQRVADRAWSYIDTDGGYEICDAIYNPNTDNCYMAFSGAATGVPGLARLDAGLSGARDAISDSGTVVVVKELVTRPLQLRAPSYELCLHSLLYYHAVSANQAGQHASVYISTNHGNSWISISPSSFAMKPQTGQGDYEEMKIDVYRSGSSVMPRIVHSGNGGAADFNVSAIVANVQLIRGIWPKSTI